MLPAFFLSVTVFPHRARRVLHRDVDRHHVMIFAAARTISMRRTRRTGTLRRGRCIAQRVIRNHDLVAAEEAGGRGVFVNAFTGAVDRQLAEAGMLRFGDDGVGIVVLVLRQRIGIRFARLQLDVHGLRDRRRRQIGGFIFVAGRSSNDSRTCNEQQQQCLFHSGLFFCDGDLLVRRGCAAIVAVTIMD